MLKIVDKRKVLDNEMIVVEGGFGAGKKVLFDTQIADIHDMKNIHVREAINRMIERNRLIENIDFLDVKNVIDQIDNNLLYELYSRMEVAKARNLYVLSERGYTKLIKMFDDNLSWDIMEQIVDDYFSMRAIVNSDKNQLLLNLFSNDAMIVAKAHKELIKLETKLLQEKIDTLEPLATRYNVFLDLDGLTDIDTFSKTLAINGLGRNGMFAWLRDNGYLQDGYNRNVPFARFVNQQKLFVVKNTGYRLTRLGEKVPTTRTFLTAKGVDYFIQKFLDLGYL